ncbi:MAG: GIY-YIG nuclease family protein [Candidatus Helarchaeota archaeon]
MHNIKVKFTYQWTPILKNEREEYCFPDQITPFMNKKYKHPAIYRWNIFRNKSEDEKLLYIGETQELCRQRLYQYLKPGGDQQTNKRINEKFYEYLREGLKIKLEILQFDTIKIGNFTLNNNDLENKHVRRFLEGLMVIIYRQKGFQILNL